MNLFSARAPLIAGFVTLIALIGGFGGWSMLTTLDGAIVAPGKVEVALNRQIVQHPEGGVVERIAVTEGQAVQAGDLLIQLDGTLIRSELAVIEGQYTETLARRARLEAERNDADAIDFSGDLETIPDRAAVSTAMDGQTRLFVARQDSFSRQTEQLEKRRAQIAAQIEGVQAQQAAITTQLALLRAELTDQQSLLAKGLTQSSRITALQRDEAQLMGDLGELISSKAQADGRATEVELEILRLGAVRREDANTQLRDMDAQELELIERRRALTEQIARLDIRAPVSGLVLGLQVTTPRSVIRPADPLLYLIPQDRPLIISAQIAPIHRDEIHDGQPVKLTLPAFSSRTTPQLNGHVTVISADALSDPRSNQPYFRAEITLDPGELARLDGQILQPGMPVEAFVQTGARTPMAYLLQPFTSYFSHAFRES